MKKLILAVCMLCASAYIMPVAAYEEEPLTFGVYYDEAKTGYNKPRTPIKRPTAFIIGHTLYIYSCEGCALHLAQDDEIVYSDVITSDTIELPESFTGSYKLLIVRGNICFWAEIEL